MKILLATTNQFGYLIDYHRYYTFLRNNGHSVTYIAWDHNKEKIEAGNPDIIYVSREGSKINRLLRFMQTIIRYENKNNYDRILINYFTLASALLLFIRSGKMTVDIRTISVHNKKYKRKIFDFMMSFAAHRYRNVSILNNFTAEHLGIKKYKLLPLGGAYFANKGSQEGGGDVQYKELFANDDFVFLYVGTLHKRKIIECVKGFHQYMREHSEVRAKFIIIGDAYGDELTKIREYISAHGLEQTVHSLGYIQQSKLSIFFNNADCGVTFIPLTPFFNLQPSTKTYEYLINGIPVIATSTMDNVQLLASTNVPSGIIIEDSAEAFSEAVGSMLDKRSVFTKEDIAHEYRQYEWDNLLDKYLVPVLELEEKKHKPQIA